LFLLAICITEFVKLVCSICILYIQGLNIYLV
jgi:hypothetical protein